MLFIKKNPNVAVEIPKEEISLDFATESCDVQGASFDIDMLCAEYAFECIHAKVQAYETVLMEMSSGAEDAKKQVESGNVDDAEYTEVKSESKSDTNKSSNANAATEKTLWQKIKAFIIKIINKVKDLWTRFVNWLTTKITSNEKFIARFKNQKLGRIKAEAYDYEAGFKRVKAMNSIAVEEFNIAKKAFNEIMSTGKHTNSDELKKIIDESKKRCEECAMKSGNPSDYNTVKNYSKDFHKGYFQGSEQFMLGEKKERDLDGNVLIKILEANKDIKNTLQKVSTTFVEQFKYTVKTIDGVKEGNTDPELRVFINYTVNFNVRLCQVTFNAAQKLIVGIRNHISACAKAATGDAN